MIKIYDLIDIGGGQSGLACGYYLRRTKLDYLILDAQEQCGGAWLHGWDSLTLFSPAQYSSLPGWMMPTSENSFPLKNEVIDYLCQYEKRYKIPIERPVDVSNVVKNGETFTIQTDKGNYQSRALISATGTWHRPFIPIIPGQALFKGKQVHAAHYQNPKPFKNQKVLIVGEGNSGAQILSEISKVAKTSWATTHPPEYLPDDVDGRVLFNLASAKYYAEQKGEKFDVSKYNLGHIVMVPSVKEARERNVMFARGRFIDMYEDGVIWEDGYQEKFDAIVWCTGYGYATDHLKGLADPDRRGKIKTKETRAVDVPGLWLVGYGGWTGFASATLIGVGRSAWQTIKETEGYLNVKK